ncbi:MAG: hypothetical protein JOZ80_12490 [Acidobacteriaceae bacterium]|nr:hypothetical protein [Acidobacteriaceae bacterium]
MISRLRKVSVFFLSTLLLPLALHAADIKINSTCELGDCTNVDALGDGQSVGPANFSYNYTVGSDTYNFSGTYAASYSNTGGNNISLTLNATYTGSGPSTGHDVISFDLLQNYYDPRPGTWDGTYTESIPVSFSGNVGTGSTVTANLCYDGSQCVGQVGPYGPGSYDVSNSAVLTGLGTGDYLDADFNFTFDFMPGTQPGAGGDVTSAPEPAQTIPAALGLALIGGFFLRRRKVSQQ